MMENAHWLAILRRKSMNNKIIITGSNGFIGKTLSERLLEEGRTVIELTRGNCDYSAESIQAIISDHRPLAIIHAAGNASVAISNENPDKAEKDTVQLTKCILQGIAQAKTPIAFIHLSSAAVYGNPKKLPIKEDSPLQPISPYGHHKLICEELVRQYSQQYPFIKPLIIRIFSLFGARQKRLVLHELFTQFQDKNLDIVTIKGTGKETRDYLSVDIFAARIATLIKALEQPPLANMPIEMNVAAGKSYTIIECAEIMAKLLNSQKPIYCAGQPIPGNPDNWEADTTLYNQVVKSIFPFDFGQELAKTLDKWKKQETE